MGVSGGGGGGTKKVRFQNQALGTISANQSSYTWYEVTQAAKRALVHRMTITPSVPGGSFYDVEVRGASGSGELWYKATDITDVALDVSIPWFFESATTSVWIGIKNRGATSKTFTLTDLRLEKLK